MSFEQSKLEKQMGEKWRGLGTIDFVASANDQTGLAMWHDVIKILQLATENNRVLARFLRHNHANPLFLRRWNVACLGWGASKYIKSLLSHSFIERAFDRNSKSDFNVENKIGNNIPLLDF